MQNSIEKFNLFMFPYAGANKYSYNQYCRQLSNSFNITVLEGTGRGGRLKEALVTNLEDIARDFFEQIRDKLSSPYIFFGHSMGSWLAYLVTHLIADHKLPLPAHLFFTGSGNPAVYRPTVIRHQLNKHDFFAHLTELGGLLPEVLNNEALLDYFEPILRADFMAVEQYRHTARPKLNIPITVLIGDSEKNVTLEMALAWQSETAGEFEVKVLKGHHFFINDHVTGIAGMLKNKVEDINTSAML